MRRTGEPETEEYVGLASAARHGSDPGTQLGDPERLVGVRGKYAVRRGT